MTDFLVDGEECLCTWSYWCYIFLVLWHDLM